MKDLVGILVEFGFTLKTAGELAQRALDNGLTPDDVRAWIREARISHSLYNPLGFVRVRLEDGDKPPTTPTTASLASNRNRYNEWAQPAPRPRPFEKKGKVNDY